MNISTGDYANNGTNETTSASTSCYVNDPFSLKLGRVIAYSVVIFASLLGNTLIIAVVSKYGRARKTINLSVMNMAVANLIITTVYMPRLIPMFLVGSVWLVDGDFGYVLCKIIPFLHSVAIIASVLTLLTSSLDTFCAVVFPLKHLFTTRVSRFAIFLTWVLAIGARFPYFLSLRTKTSATGRQTCGSSLNKLFNNKDARDIYYTFLLVSFYAIPWLMIFIFYSTIAITLKTGKTPRQESATAVRLNGLRVRATRNVIKMMIVITLVFLVCWIIYFLAQVAYRKVPCSFRFWRLFLAHCNCAINPILFAVFNTTVRRGIKDIMKKMRAPLGHPHLDICESIFGSVFRRKTVTKTLYISRPRNRKRNRSQAFSMNTTINMTKLSEVNRRGAVRWKVGNDEAEFGIVNQGSQELENNNFPNATLSFNTLK